MIPLPPPSKILEKKGNKTVFEIEALYPGYGVTIANSLRRVLFSSLEGAAVTQVKIKGVPHEFSTIPGVLEDVISILLNFKQMRFRMYGNEPQKAILKVKGEKEVMGSDFEFPTQAELINPEISIAHLTDKNSNLEIEIQIEKGIGYVPAEIQKRGRKEEIGAITLDAIFTPIKGVSYKVEHMRVGDRTDFDRVRLEIETDGTITPEEALWQSSQILLKQFELIGEGVKEKIKKKEEAKEGKEIKKTRKRKEKKETNTITKKNSKKA